MKVIFMMKFLSTFNNLVPLSLSVFSIGSKVDPGSTSAASAFCQWVQSIDIYIYIYIYIYIFLIINTRSSLVYLHDLQLLVLLPYIIEITLFICTITINPLCIRPSSNREIVIKGCIQLPNLFMLKKQSLSGVASCFS